MDFSYTPITVDQLKDELQNAKISAPAINKITIRQMRKMDLKLGHTQTWVMKTGDVVSDYSDISESEEDLEVVFFLINHEWKIKII